MSAIEYIAKRSLIDGHVENVKYVVEVFLRAADGSRVIVSSAERSPGGGMEVSLERIESTWQFTFLIRSGTQLLAMRELLDSTESGETFRVWLYGDPDDPETPVLNLKRSDSGHSEIVLARRAGGAEDLFTASISAVESMAFDPVTLEPIEGGVDSDTTDVYDPDDGGSMGGLDPLPPPTLSDPTPTGTLDDEDSVAVGATTDQPEGTLYVVIGTGSQLSGVTVNQVKAGQQANGSAALFDGSETVSDVSPAVEITGLSADTAYTYAIVQENDNGDSNIVSGTFTTASASAGVATLIAFGNSLTTNQGVIAKSINGGSSWNVTEPVGLPDLTIVAFSPTLGRFVAITSTSGGYYSDNYGATWTSWTFPIAFSASDLIWSPLVGRFIATTASTSSASHSYSSADGITWTVTSTGAATGSTSRGLVECGDRVISLRSSTIWETTNGTSWTRTVISPTMTTVGISGGDGSSDYSPSLGILACVDSDSAAYAPSPFTGWTAGSFSAAGQPSCAWSADLGVFTSGFESASISTDGISWNNSGATAVSGIPAPRYGTRWCPAAGVFMSVGADTGTNGVICLSADGKVWSTSHSRSQANYQTAFEVIVPP